ncbi:hypothetical protein [Streptomyces sp. NPDC058268]|uniref:hypothetical protein n=1 Tax=Streptomyces sp. NPDC058268 TaxID=3346413 RepID=UPI0036E84F50
MSMSLRQLPGDPGELYLQIAFRDDLYGTPHDETLERWEISIRHRPETLENGTAPLDLCGERAEQERPVVEGDLTVGQMIFYRVRLDRGMNAVFITPRLERPSVSMAA